MTVPRTHDAAPEVRLRRDRIAKPEPHAASLVDKNRPLTRADLRRRRAASSSAVSEQSVRTSEEERIRTVSIPASEAVTETETVSTTSASHPATVRSPRMTLSAPAGNHARRVSRKLAAIGALVVAGTFTVGMTFPAAVVGGQALGAATRYSAPAQAAQVPDDQIQAFVTPGEVRTETLDRQSGFSVASTADIAAVAGIRHFTGSNPVDPDAAVQWPFPVGVPTSSNYGPRGGRQHEGADFTPGEGAEIQAIAGGVVRIATEQGGAFGVTVYIEHVVDGQTVFSRYAHMQYGSLKVFEGQNIGAGQKLGLVGNTGRSFGAHLHLEITTDDGKVNPVAWLQEKTRD